LSAPTIRQLQEHILLAQVYVLVLVIGHSLLLAVTLKRSAHTHPSARFDTGQFILELFEAA